MSPARAEMSKADRWRRWVIAGVKFAGVARLPRLVPSQVHEVCCFGRQCELLKFCLTSVVLNSLLFQPGVYCARADRHIRCLLLSLPLSSVLLSDVTATS